MPPRHALDVLIAFRMDVTKLRYENWDEVIHYCRYSAMPVGRFMLDVHGESTSTWAASDALCAGLQINNHLQDCGKDYQTSTASICRAMRWPQPAPRVEMLGEARAPAPLLQCLHALAARTEALLDESRSLGGEVRDFRLGLEISVIQAFADRIVRLLKVRDPLSERVHLSPLELLGCSIGGMARRDRPPRGGTAARVQTGGRRMTLEAAAASAELRDAPRPAARSMPRCASCRARSARRCSRSTASAARSTTSPIPTGRGPSGCRAAAMARRHRRALSGPSAAAAARLCRLGAKFGLKREDFLAIIDGMEMDVPQDIRAPDLATLDLYCDRVASAVGRLSVRVFGLPRSGRHPACASPRPRAAIDQHPARHRRGCRARPAVSAARRLAACRHHRRRSAQGGRRPGAAEGLRAAGRAGAGAFREGRRDDGAQSRAARCGRRGSCRNTIARSSICWSRGALRRRARRSASASCPRLAIILRYAFI